MSTAFTWQESLVGIQLRAFIFSSTHMSTLLKDDIQKIISLQEIDSHIHELKRQENVTLPEQINELADNFQIKKDNFGSCGESFKQVQLKKKERELELASKEEGLRKFQGQLYQLKTNKEYHAKLTEIGGIKADISVAEEDLLKTMEEIDTEKEKLEDAKKALADEEKNYKVKEKELQDKIKNIKIEIAESANKRKQFTSEIKPKVLSRYEELLQSRNGLAIVPIRGSICGACHMRVTHQKINEVKMYNNLAFCENCVRILYIPEDSPI
jgi:uncharacterized protein